MRRHFKRTHLEQAKPAGWTVWGVELVDTKFSAMRVTGDVDQQVAQQPIHQPGRRRLAIATQAADLRKGDFELMQGIVACLINPWCLTGGTDEEA